jgi:hypothetical protein
VGVLLREFGEHLVKVRPALDHFDELREGVLLVRVFGRSAAGEKDFCGEEVVW